jgi:hypothetical protein
MGGFMSIDECILFFLITWLVIFFCDYFFILRSKLNYLLGNNKKKNKKIKNVDITEISYLAKKFKIEKRSLYKTSIILWIGLLNAFIISLTSTIITMIPLNIAWQFLIGFALLFGLIYAIYELFGRVLIRKGY